jgi:UDP-N-acetyl-D-glucosamine dehydrogenase
MRAVVVALGKIGLPVAVKLALAGHEVVGCDANPSVVDLEYSALSPGDVPGLRALVDGRAIVHEGPWLAAGIPLSRIGQPQADSGESRERPTQQPGAAAVRS